MKETSGETILSLFEEITSIPRSSGHEATLARWIDTWAKKHGFGCRTDRGGNIVVDIPPSQGVSAEPLILQAHMDMVCEKTPDKEIDFFKDPIPLIREENIIRADRTSLGADNGIGIAAALALSVDPTVKHPPLELLFTVEEETSMKGVSLLEKGFLKGKTLINIDGEDDTVFNIGCAGGRSFTFEFDLQREVKSQEQMNFFSVKVSGLRGGHSGVDIHEERANAIKTSARLLKILPASKRIQLLSLHGGTVHNAIPRECSTLFALPASVDEKLILSACCEFERIMKNEMQKTDPNLSIVCEKMILTEGNRSLVSAEMSELLLDTLLVLPHGVIAMSKTLDHLVETSCNCATVEVIDKCAKIVVSARSSLRSHLQAVSCQMEAVANLAGCQFSASAGYPAWTPDLHSAIVKTAVNVYAALFSKKPEVKAIHAGLECGMLGEKFPQLDMIAVGCNIRNAHSPQEYVEIESVRKMYRFLQALVSALC